MSEFSLAFTLPVIKPVYDSFRPLFREAFSWCLDKKELLDAVANYLDQGDENRTSAYLVRALLAYHSYKYQTALRWAKVAQNSGSRLNHHSQLRWSQAVSNNLLIVLGNNLLEEGKLRQAEVVYKQACEVWQEWGNSWVNLGGSYLLQGKLDDALSAFKQAVEKFCHGAEEYAWWGMADIFYQKGDLEKAESVALEGIRVCGEEAHLLCILGRIKLDKWDLLSAIVSFERALCLEPEDDRIWSHWALALEKIGLYSQAIIAYRRAITLDRYIHIDSKHLISLFLKINKFADAAKEMESYLVYLVEKAKIAPLLVARFFADLARSELLTHYHLVANSDCPDKPPGCGKHIVDLYLVTVQQCLLGGLKNRELESLDVITGLFHIGKLWCLYGSQLQQRGLSKQFIRERLYTLKQEVVDTLPRELKLFGFASSWPELQARMKTTSPEEFAHEMLKQEPKWLKSVGKSREQGEVEDLRWRLQGNLWIHVFEYQREQKIEHLQRIHYYAELLKGHTVLHKLIDLQEVIEKTRASQKWNRYVNSLPVKIDRTAIVDLETCAALLPEDTVALGFYFLHRELLPSLLLVIVLKHGESPSLHIVEDKGRLTKFKNAAMRLKEVHIILWHGDQKYPP